jgi:hypothetical protein
MPGLDAFVYKQMRDRSPFTCRRPFPFGGHAVSCVAERAWQYPPATAGVNREPNRYGGKIEGLLALPLIALTLLLA